MLTTLLLMAGGVMAVVLILLTLVGPLSARASSGRAKRLSQINLFMS